MSGFWLPPELWKNVFALATRFNGEFDIRDWICRSDKEMAIPAEMIDLKLSRINVTSPDSNQFLLHQNPEFQDQRILRRTLVLVSKNWYDMCLEFLYGSVVLYDSTTISGCINTLKRVENLARTVRRLEICLDDPEVDEDSEIISRRYISELVKLCPNLVIFHGSIEEAEDIVSDALIYARVPLQVTLATHCKELRHAMGSHLIYGYPARTFYRHISSFTNLIALQLPPNLGTMAAVERPAIILPNIRILDLGYQAPFISPEFGRYLSRWELPALDAVHLGTLSPNMALQRFWGAHGSKLRTIRLYNASNWVFGRRLTNINLGLTAPSNELFPNLQQLIILHNTPTNIAVLFFPSNTLEIYEVPLHGTWRVNDPLTAHLESQIGSHHITPLLKPRSHMTPNLRVVRISRCPTTKDRSERGIRCGSLLRSAPTWKEELGSRGVALELLYGEE